MRLFSILMLMSLLMAGCANYASYPSLEGKQRADGPISAPVPEVIATAIEWCVAREDFREQEKPVVFQLPSGMDESAHEAVVRELGKSNLNSTVSSADGIVIRSVRLFGLKAMVDMSVPRNYGNDQLVTLELQSYAFQPWRVVAANRWRFNEEQLKRTKADMIQASVEGDQ
ncbi:MAG: hypothetical protein P8J89_09470 [Phycisphaerales bacterium]|nr:hypothetical protein [Phycisphaerales bacterium]